MPSPSRNLILYTILTNKLELQFTTFNKVSTDLLFIKNSYFPHLFLYHHVSYLDSDNHHRLWLWLCIGSLNLRLVLALLVCRIFLTLGFVIELKFPTPTRLFQSIPYPTNIQDQHVFSNFFFRKRKSVLIVNTKIRILENDKENVLNICRIVCKHYLDHLA